MTQTFPDSRPDDIYVAPGSAAARCAVLVIIATWGEAGRRSLAWPQRVGPHPGDRSSPDRG